MFGVFPSFRRLAKKARGDLGDSRRKNCALVVFIPGVTCTEVVELLWRGIRVNSDPPSPPPDLSLCGPWTNDKNIQHNNISSITTTTNTSTALERARFVVGSLSSLNIYHSLMQISGGFPSRALAEWWTPSVICSCEFRVSIYLSVFSTLPKKTRRGFSYIQPSFLESSMDGN